MMERLLQPYVKYIWIAILSLMALTVLWFTCKASYHLYQFLTISQQVTAKEVNWSVETINDERYLLQGNYHFNVDDVTYNGQDLLQTPVFRNLWAAEQMVPRYTSQQWKIWYSPSNPVNSTLQKNLPVKEFVSTMLLWAVLIYFIWLNKRFVKIGVNETSEKR